jgi:CBS domain-containing protein
MQAKDLMTPDVECVSPDTKIPKVARIMKLMDIGFVPVCDNDRLIGVVTDRDIVLRAVAEDMNIKDSLARDVMTEDLCWCYDDQTADEIAEYMSSHEVRRVVILDRKKRLAGVISIGDLAKRGEQAKAGEAIGDIAEAPPANAA